jgi:hypothetical protein
MFSPDTCWSSYSVAGLARTIFSGGLLLFRLPCEVSVHAFAVAWHGFGVQSFLSAIDKWEERYWEG